MVDGDQLLSTCPLTKNGIFYKRLRMREVADFRQWPFEFSPEGGRDSVRCSAFAGTVNADRYRWSWIPLARVCWAKRPESPFDRLQDPVNCVWWLYVALFASGAVFTPFLLIWLFLSKIYLGFRKKYPEAENAFFVSKKTTILYCFIVFKTIDNFNIP